MKLRRIITVVAVVALATTLITGCGKDKTDAGAGSDAAPVVVKVGASPVPHAAILEAAKPAMLEKGYDLQIVEFTDYVLPNNALNDGSLVANFFQHKPYLDDFNKEKKMDLKSAVAVHYEPLGLYGGKVATIAEIPDGASIAVPNDTTNEARALLLLESLGLIKVDPNAGLSATKKDIIENPKNLKIEEVDAALVSKVLPDVAMGVINGNFALQAGLNAQTDSIAKEEKDSLAAETYANILAIRNADENLPEVKALVEVLTSPEMKAFIEKKYQGSVVPMF